MDLIIKNQNSISKEDLSIYHEDIPLLMERCREVWLREKDGNKPVFSIDASLLERDIVRVIVKKPRRFRMKFEDDQGKIRYKVVTWEMSLQMNKIIENGGSIKTKINDKLYLFTRFQFKGMSELDTEFFDVELTITDEEKERRSDMIRKFYSMGKNKGVNFDKANKDNIELVKRKKV